VPLGFLTDEDFHGRILGGLLHHMPGLDIVRVQDIGLAGEPDDVVLDWAAQNGRILLTHDERTMVGEAYDRLRAGLRMPGVCLVPQSLSIGRAVRELVFTIQCSLESDWDCQVLYLPL
jgi:hypothetical protein